MVAIHTTRRHRQAYMIADVALHGMCLLTRPTWQVNGALRNLLRSWDGRLLRSTADMRGTTPRLQASAAQWSGELEDQVHPGRAMHHAKALDHIRMFDDLLGRSRRKPLYRFPDTKPPALTREHDSRKCPWDCGSSNFGVCPGRLSKGWRGRFEVILRFLWQAT